MPSDSPKKNKTIDGIKKKFAKILEKRHQKKYRVEISYRYEKIYKELKWNWEDLGLLIGDIIDELTGLKNPSIPTSPKERIYRIRYCPTRKRSAYKESDWIEAFEGTKQELSDWWEEYYEEIE